MEPSYIETLKIVWLILWRQGVYLIVVYLFIGFLTMHLFSSSSTPSLYQDVLQLIVAVLYVLWIMPTVIRGVFHKQFDGYRVIFERQRDAHEPDGRV